MSAGKVAMSAGKVAMRAGLFGALRLALRRALLSARFAGLVGLVGLVGACGGDGEEVKSTGYTNVGDVQEAGGLGGDADAVEPEVSADAGPDTATAPEDADVVDAAPEDAASGTDAAAIDSGPPDAGSADTAPADTAPVDTANSPCDQKAQVFAQTALKAKVCKSDLDCYGPHQMIEGLGWLFGGQTKAGCACPTYYNGNSAEAQAVLDLAAEYNKAGCPDTCPNVDCASLKGTVGACQQGNCQVKSMTCGEMEAAVKVAVAAGRACTKDADCSPFGMQGELPCGCAVNVNMDKMAPGQPIFLYVTMLAQAYNFQECAKGVVCACPAVGPGVCKANVCTTK